MNQQNYKNHIRYYPPHHFVFYPVIAACMAFGIYCAVHYPERQIEFGFLTVIVFLIGWLAFMLRQHYALMNQDRTVRLELRLRFYELTGERLEPYEKQLSLKQLLATRFADDTQFPVLLKQAAKERLSPDDIKKAVVNWQADAMRV